MLVERHQLAQRLRGQPLGQDRARRAVALTDTVRHQPLRRPFGPHFLGRLAEGQRLGLGEQVGHEQVVVVAERVQRLAEPDEVAGNELCPLVDELVERVLAVRARLAPVDRPRLVVDRPAVQRDVLAVTLHCELLQVRREAFEILVVGHDPDRLRAEEVVVPHGEQPHQHR